MIQGGICGKLLLLILFRRMVDYLIIDFIQRPNGLIDFSFLDQKCSHMLG